MRRMRKHKRTNTLLAASRVSFIPATLGFCFFRGISQRELKPKEEMGELVSCRPQCFRYPLEGAGRMELLNG